MRAVLHLLTTPVYRRLTYPVESQLFCCQAAGCRGRDRGKDMPVQMVMAVWWMRTDEGRAAPAHNTSVSQVTLPNRVAVVPVYC